jgi:hypothetical protein
MQGLRELRCNTVRQGQEKQIQVIPFGEGLRVRNLKLQGTEQVPKAGHNIRNVLAGESAGSYRRKFNLRVGSQDLD